MRILLIDDDESFRTALGRYLTARGHEVVTFVDGAGAEATALSEPFGVAVCDIRMIAGDLLEVRKMTMVK